MTRIRIFFFRFYIWRMTVGNFVYLSVATAYKMCMWDISFTKYKPGDVGRDSTVGIATRYGLEGLGIESRRRRDFPHPSKPAAHPDSCTICTGSFQRMKRPGPGVNYVPPTSAEVKETVELYLHSPCGPSLHVIGYNLLSQPDDG
jgi:hypothetical protein